MAADEGGLYNSSDFGLAWYLGSTGQAGGTTIRGNTAIAALYLGSGDASDAVKFMNGYYTGGNESLEYSYYVRNKADKFDNNTDASGLNGYAGYINMPGVVASREDIVNNKSNNPLIGFTGSSIVVTNQSISLPSPLGTTTMTQYVSTSAGSKGSIGTVNISFLKEFGEPSSIEYNNGLFGVSISHDGVLIEGIFGHSTYGIGLAKDGFLFDSSVESNGVSNGQLTKYQPTPLTTIGHVLEPLGQLFKPLMRDLTFE